MKLFGLGSAACLSPLELYQLALSAGFPPGFTPYQGNAGTMAAIAMRESRGCPDVTNLSSTEQSYGLWQINTAPGANPIETLGLTDPTQLQDPGTNAQAAYQIWGGNDANLDVAWYVRHGGSYTSEYLANLVAVQAAVETTGVGVPGLQNVIQPVTGGDTILSAGVVIAAVATVGLLLLLDRE